MRVGRMILVAGLAAILVLGAAPSQAATAGALAARHSFVPAVIVVSEGSDLTFMNADPAMHSLTAIDVTPGTNQPLFDSGVMVAAQTGAVAGIAALPVNQAGYEFFCTIHPDMRGRLIVL